MTRTGRRLAPVVLALAVLCLTVSTSQAAAGDYLVRAVNTEFRPPELTVEVGKTVTWRAKEGTHTVTARNGRFAAHLNQGDTVTRRFRRIGTWRYYCAFHEGEGMVGKVVVVE